MPSEKKYNQKFKIYFIVPAPLGISPGQRFRFEHYLPFLNSYGISFRVSPFYSTSGWKVIYSAGKIFQKSISTLAGFFRRLRDITLIPFYSHVYLYREAAPVGPPAFEWIIAKLLRKKIIYDFDDAIWIPVTSEQNRIVRSVKNFSKIATICKLSFIVSVGNSFLKKYAENYCKNVVVIPTVVDTDKVHNHLQDHKIESPVVGWTGTFSTLKYLDIILPAIRVLQEKHDFTFIVIANKNPDLTLKNYQYINWNKESEISDLLKIHIGIMPLYDNELEKGKCGFKAIQFMALGIPVIVSPVGANKEIVDHETEGYFAVTEEEWVNSIEKLLLNAGLRERLGTNGRNKIDKCYSVKSTLERFLNLFEC